MRLAQCLSRVVPDPFPQWEVGSLGWSIDCEVEQNEELAAF